jgi:hypothetical protein
MRRDCSSSATSGLFGYAYGREWASAIPDDGGVIFRCVFLSDRCPQKVALELLVRRFIRAAM